MSITLTLNKAAELLACQQTEHDAVITGAKIDSRQVEKGDLFVAFAGEHVDGHDYIAAARLAGASGALVSKLQDDPLPQLCVADVTSAFGKLAHYICQQSDAKVIAITGSNGKTTVKEMVASILALEGEVVATKANLNNNLGVPLTLFRLKESTDYAVIEMGANHPGEIAELVKIAQPDVAIINNVAPAHLEGFGSVEGVADAKAEIFSQLDQTGTAIINADMAFVDRWQQALTDKKVVSFALDNEADVKARDIELAADSSQFTIESGLVSQVVNLPIPGLHNVANALAASAICMSLNINADTIARGLQVMTGVPHRLQLRPGPHHSQLIDDSYNANPGSFQQALQTLGLFSGQRWFVLGDFGELGSDSEQIHQSLGQQAKQADVQRLLTIGEQSRFASDAFGEGAEHFTDLAALQKTLSEQLNDTVTCLIKGSRFMQLDKLADALTVAGEN